MKQFLQYLAIGLSAGLCLALAACYVVWSMHSVHRQVWFFIVLLCALFVYRYMSEPDWVEYENKDGNTDYDKVGMREMTISEKFGVVLRTVVGIGILGALVWTIGYGVACFFEWKPDFWEMNLLYGGLTLLAIGFVIWVIYICNSLLHNRFDIRKTAKSVLMWGVIVLCGLAVSAGILYLLLPLAMRS